YMLLIVISFIVPRIFMIEKDSINTYSIMIVFSNISFMGMPIVRSLVGESGLLYAAIYVIPFNVLIYTSGIAMLKRNKGNKSDVRQMGKSIINIGTIASIIAIVIFALDVPIPYVISESCDMLGNLTAPLSMMVIGASFATIIMGKLFIDVRLLLFFLFKQFIIPIVGITILRLFINDEMIVDVMFVMLATPVASMVAMLTQEYDGDFMLATRGVALSTIISVISIPIISTLMNI
ncbi:MAG: AEC family transporter, partial [Clostridia bacterium]|nr:AEC family transporter [Clostridia bacterium]